MIPDRIRRRLQWALNMYEWGFKSDALQMLENVARHVTKEGEEVDIDGVETIQTGEEESDGRKGFGFGFRA